MRKALVVIDMQNDFVTGALGSAEAQAIVPYVAEKIRQAKQSGIEVFFTRDTHGEDYLSTAEGKKLPVKHCIKGTEGWEIVPELDCSGAEIVDKPTFGSLELAERLKGFDEVTLCGVCTDICVISNAVLIKTVSPETRVCADSRCVAATSVEANIAALKTMQSLQIDVL